MKARGVLGRRILEVRQTKFYNRHTGGMELHVDAIVLEGGVIIRPVVSELEDSYGVDFSVTKRGKRNAK